MAYDQDNPDDRRMVVKDAIASQRLAGLCLSELDLRGRFETC